MTDTLFVGELLMGSEVPKSVAEKAIDNMWEVDRSAFLAGVTLTPEQRQAQLHWERVLLMYEAMGIKYYK